MSPTIRIDDDVYAALQSQAVPFVDTPNSVIRRVLGLPAQEESPVDSSAESPRSARRQRKKKQPERKRAAKGSILPESMYELPILQTLHEMGDEGPSAEVLKMLEPKLLPLLTELDLERLDSGRLRWHNRAQFARLNLVRSGDLLENSPRGIWKLSEAGRERLQQSMGDSQ